MKVLIAEIKKKLGIDGGYYIDAEIEDYIQNVDKSQYLEFFKALSGSHEFSKPIDRIANVAKRFTSKKKDLILAGTHEQAKAMYDKFEREHSLMTDYTQDNRDKVPNDREFFVNVDYSKVKRKFKDSDDYENVYTKQELYVLNELGGGAWLYDIRFKQNSSEIVDTIEKIIKDAKIEKHLKQNAIESKKVMKLVGDLQ